MPHYVTRHNLCKFSVSRVVLIVPDAYHNVSQLPYSYRSLFFQSIAGLAWTEAFVNKESSVGYQHGISREVLIYNFIKNQKPMDVFEGD